MLLTPLEQAEILAIELHGLDVELGIKRFSHQALVKEIRELEALRRHVEYLLGEVRKLYEAD